ncbi:TlpA family protein disulfide reductase [Nocardioides sp. GCM10027113]|uniref:TlpA family protein disulfide reductase n=1 Tax=unclassified Nocardioides TaxID=2615069 RepID=UPI003622D9C7
MRILTAVAAFLVLVLAGCGTATDAPSGQSGQGSQDGRASAAEAPPAGEVRSVDFAADTVAGEPFDGASLEGKPAVLWFWAPWCPTCRAQIDGVSELAAEHGDAVNVVGVGALDDPEAIAGFAAEVGDDVTLLSDPRGDVWRHFGVTGQSTYLVLDAEGRERASGFLDDPELASIVDALAG